MSLLERARALGDRVWDRSWELYDRAVLRRPRASLCVLALVSAACCLGLKDFRADASGDSLVLEHDDDVKFARAVGARYENSDFVVIAYEPPEGIFAEPALDRLKGIREDLRKVPGVASVVTILDVPLLRNPPGPLKELKQRMKTLESPGAKLRYAIDEFRTSPIYRDQLVSADFKSTAIQVNFRVDAADRELTSRRAELREKEYRKTIPKAERAELKGLEARYRAYMDRLLIEHHLQLAAIRGIIRARGAEARFHLGGIPMIIDDIMAYISHDVIVFGLAIILFMMGTLYAIYGNVRWVLLSVGGCVLSVAIMMGGMGFTHWDVTVVSANFVTLQLILTMELAIYIISRYRELLAARPGADNHDLVFQAVREAFVPALYMKLTTIVGFEALIFIYWLVPAAMVLFPKPSPKEGREWGAPVTSLFARVAVEYKPAIYAVTVLVALATAVGIARLQVENSFVDYFRKDTDIYKGMRYIDQSLGGTTPIDIILNLGAPQAAPKAPAKPAADADFAEFQEFGQSEGDPAKYWYTAERIATIEKVHDYLETLPEAGKVLSLATLKKMAVILNGGAELDSMGLALLYQSVSDRFRDFLITPYVSIENGEARITARIKDSSPTLRRSELIQRIRKDLVAKVGLREDQFRISGLMLLYNNMLQSLYTSQIKSIGFSMLVLFVTLLLLFRSVKISLIALLPQALASLTVLGVMGLGGISLDVMTITIVSVALGIAVNNTIQYLYRFEKEILKDGDYLRAMRASHHTIGNPILYTSLTITVGFLILSLSKFVPTVLFGLLIGLAMVVACLSSLILLPALVFMTKPFGRGKT
ncbi:MAG: MMPL family transporter [Elusimicrobia bacterium]|nr:MMPL family transporter [Elusimicrobiota bacterium]